MNIYIAGAWESRQRLQGSAALIRQHTPHTVVSSWLDDDSTYEPSEADLLNYAVRDRYEVALSRVLFLDTFSVTARGGREVEFGMALAGGLVTVVCGPLRNVFHRLADHHFESWTEAIEWLR